MAADTLCKFPKDFIQQRTPCDENGEQTVVWVKTKMCDSSGIAESKLYNWNVKCKCEPGSVVTVDDAVTSCTPCNEGEFHADGFVLDMSDFAKEGWNN
eukprot:gene27805-33530_t